MTNYLLLAVAILCEVIGTTALKASDGFTRLWPGVIVVLAYGASFYFLALALRSIPIGIAYALWAGFGIVLVALSGVILFQQKLDAPAVAGMALIIAGAVVINVFSSVGHR